MRDFRLRILYRPLTFVNEVSPIVKRSRQAPAEHAHDAPPRGELRLF